MFCPKCKAEYRKGYTICVDCEVDLVESLGATSKKKKFNENVTFVPVLSTYNLGDIALIKSILDDQWIEYFFQGENTSYIRGAMDPAILMVREDQVPSVIELLKNFDVKYMMFSSK
ncbi:MAG: putative signal transducing protein [Ignavibacteriaceae bacterium]